MLCPKNKNLMTVVILVGFSCDFTYWSTCTQLTFLDENQFLDWFNVFSTHRTACHNVLSWQKNYVSNAVLEIAAFSTKNSTINRSLIPSSFVVMYADDILLIAPSVSELQRLFHACEFELSCLDMCINTKKSCCIRIGPRYDVKCASISTMTGQPPLG